MKKIFSILIVFTLILLPVGQVSAATKTAPKTTTKKVVKKKVATKKKVVKKAVKKIIINPPLITLETAPHSAKPIAKKSTKNTKKKKA